MKTEDFNYELDEKYIAQSPLQKRENSKLMLVDENGEINHFHFFDIVDLLSEDDVLVLNNSKVLPARLFGKNENETKIEVLLIKEIDKDIWECMVKPGKRAKLGKKIIFDDNFFGDIIDIKEGLRIFKFHYEGNFYENLDRLGVMPLPPYIKEKLEKKDRYQTIYAKNLGSVAAPTAGLHFTKKLLDEIEKKGIKIAYVTLHVGIGTFRPVKVDNVLEHKMHSESFEIDEENAKIINNAIKNKKRVVAVGTTTVRVLESVYNKYNEIKRCDESTDIFIYPGYEFKVVDSLITNFHLPKSTLLMLVSAFLDKEKIFNAYEEAKKNNYRFFSFGDAMFLKGKIDV